MKEFTVRLAGLPVAVSCEYLYTFNQCRNYLSQEEPAIFAKADDRDISYSMERSGISREAAESFAVYKSIADQLSRFDRLVFHGAAITYCENGYLFSAPSGTGKTTHIKLWKRFFKDKVDIINGDKPIISAGSDGVYIHGTPWAGKEGWNKNLSAPLSGICFVRQSRENRIKRLSPDKCLGMILPQVYIPKKSGAAGATLELLDRILKNVPVYMLDCDISEEAVKCSFEAMTGLKYSENK